MIKILIDEAVVRQALEALELHGKQYPHMVKGYCLDAIIALRQALEQPAPAQPLSEETIWEIKLKSHQKYVSRKWIEETDTRSGHYEDVERHTDSPVAFARAIEAAHGITKGKP